MVGTSSNSRVLPIAVLVIGVAQAILVALALSRILDPGWTTFGPVGVLAGLGMAALALVALLDLRWRSHGHRRVAWLGVVAGLSIGATWASLLGGTFYTNDLVRIAIVVASDCAFAIALVGATRWTDERTALPGIGIVATFMSARAVIEILLICLVLTQEGRGSGPNIPVVALAISVLVGWVVLAVWEVVVGAQLLRARSRR